MKNKKDTENSVRCTESSVFCSYGFGKVELFLNYDGGGALAARPPVRGAGLAHPLGGVLHGHLGPPTAQKFRRIDSIFFLVPSTGMTRRRPTPWFRLWERVHGGAPSQPFKSEKTSWNGSYRQRDNCTGNELLSFFPA